MSDKLISGVYAAILTPRSHGDRVDTDALHIEVSFLIGKGITGFAINGATGEFPITTSQQLELILRTVRHAAEDRAEILCGIGAPSTARTIELAAVADGERVKALLLPMPSFFPYQQQDLEAFCHEVASSTPLPTLLYNLPQFTSGLQKETVRRLITEVPNIIGIKDSSGSLDILRDLTHHNVDACRIVGNDTALCPALHEDLCDGVVSGVACVLPELIQRIYAQRETTQESLLSDFIAQLAPFPTPWGLKWIAEARGLFPATFSQPVTAHRKAQATELVDWFAKHSPQLTEPAK